MFDPPEPQPTTAAKRNVATTEPRSIVLFRTVDMGETLVVALRNGSPPGPFSSAPLLYDETLQLAAFGDKGVSGENYVVRLDGGSPKRVELSTANSTCTSPSENAIVFTVIRQATHPGEKIAFDLRILDPESSTLCLVPSSQGILGGLWIGQGKLVAATEDFSKLLIFDFNSGHWTELVSGSFVNWMPSPDGKYLYYATAGGDPRAMRIHLTDRKVETAS